MWKRRLFFKSSLIPCSVGRPEGSLVIQNSTLQSSKTQVCGPRNNTQVAREWAGKSMLHKPGGVWRKGTMPKELLRSLNTVWFAIEGRGQNSGSREKMKSDLWVHKKQKQWSLWPMWIREEQIRPKECLFLFFAAVRQWCMMPNSRMTLKLGGTAHTLHERVRMALDWRPAIQSRA